MIRRMPKLRGYSKPVHPPQPPHSQPGRVDVELPPRIDVDVDAVPLVGTRIHIRGCLRNTRIANHRAQSVHKGQ